MINNRCCLSLRKGKVVQVSIRETKFLHLNIQIIQRDKYRWTEHDQSSLPIYRFMLFLETVLEKSRRCSVDFLATEDSLVTANVCNDRRWPEVQSGSETPTNGRKPPPRSPGYAFLLEFLSDFRTNRMKMFAQACSFR